MNYVKSYTVKAGYRSGFLTGKRLSNRKLKDLLFNGCLVIRLRTAIIVNLILVALCYYLRVTDLQLPNKIEIIYLCYALTFMVFTFTLNRGFNVTVLESYDLSSKSKSIGYVRVLGTIPGV